MVKEESSALVENAPTWRQLASAGNFAALLNETFVPVPEN